MSDTTESIHKSCCSGDKSELIDCEFYQNEPQIVGGRIWHPVRYRINYRPATLWEKALHWWRGYGWISEVAAYEAIHFGEPGYEKACFENSIVVQPDVFNIKVIR